MSSFPVALANKNRHPQPGSSLEVRCPNEGGAGVRKENVQTVVRGSVRSCFVKIELVAIYGVNIFCFVLSVILIK